MGSLQSLHDEWAKSKLGAKRVHGGRNALSGFRYQLYLSLDRFFVQVLEGNRNAQFAFDGLSDLAELKNDLIYLTQAKITLNTSTLRSAVDEAKDLWRFVADEHPELLGCLRYQIATRRVSAALPIDLSVLSGEKLGLAAEDCELLAAIKSGHVSVEIRGNPRVDLAIRLWPHAQQCFTLVERCLARLFDLLGNNQPSTDIAEVLLELWDKARADKKPPCHLLGVRELASVPTSSTRIVHGVQPRPDDLDDGCFMDRPALLQAVLSTIRETSLELGASPGRHAIPVFWIVGPSGAGKSVLLLQVMRELVLNGDVEAANYLGEFAHALPRALDYWSGASERALIAVDDLFAPENRDPQLWQQVGELAFMANWGQMPWILTCGPTEQLNGIPGRGSPARRVAARRDPDSANGVRGTSGLSRLV